MIKVLFNSYPKHTAIIMDGNGRWAKNKGLPRIAGHREGAKRAREIIEVSITLKLQYLTLFAFSSENWSRPKREVSDLMKLLNATLNKDFNEYLQKNVQLRVIGNRDRIDINIKRRIEELEKLTIKNKGLKLTIALDYGGREDILFALKNIIERKIKIKEIDFKLISESLMTQHLPDPDLIIRTSGEIRISNFFLWQAAYSEFDFVKCFWPDFNREKFFICLDRYKNRERRYGNINE